MATNVWCDRVQYVVREPRTEIERLLSNAWQERDLGAQPGGFIYVTPVHGDTQTALRVSAITSFAAVPGDPL